MMWRCSGVALGTSAENPTAAVRVAWRGYCRFGPVRRPPFQSMLHGAERGETVIPPSNTNTPLYYPSLPIQYYNGQNSSATPTSPPPPPQHHRSTHPRYHAPAAGGPTGNHHHRRPTDRPTTSKVNASPTKGAPTEPLGRRQRPPLRAPVDVPRINALLNAVRRALPSWLVEGFLRRLAKFGISERVVAAAGRGWMGILVDVAPLLFSFMLIPEGLRRAQAISLRHRIAEGYQPEAVSAMPPPVDRSKPSTNKDDDSERGGRKK